MKKSVDAGSGIFGKTAQYISTLEAARLCGVSTFSVQRWFDEGLLKGARLPGGKRKIEAESLKRFMQEHGLLPSASAVREKRTRVLVMESDAKLLDVIKESLARGGECLVETASNGLDAGMALAEFKPDAVVVSVAIEDIPGASLVQRIRQSPLGRSVRIIALTGKKSQDDIKEIRAAGANAVLVKPFGMQELAKALKSATGA
jgi:excisionase family DNA binding protein